MKHSPIKVSIFHFVRLIFINLQGFPNHASQNYPASSTSQRLQIILKHLVLSYQYTRTSVQTHCFKRRREKIIIFLVCTYRKKTREMLLGTICFTHMSWNSLTSRIGSPLWHCLFCKGFCSERLKILPYIHFKSNFFQFKTLFSILPLQVIVKCLSSSFFNPPLKHWKAPALRASFWPLDLLYLQQCVQPILEHPHH